MFAGSDGHGRGLRDVFEFIRGANLRGDLVLVFVET
jgi:hypothetical protein